VFSLQILDNAIYQSVVNCSRIAVRECIAPIVYLSQVSANVVESQFAQVRPIRDLEEHSMELVET
jgi:hypothetical protein